MMSMPGRPNVTVCVVTYNHARYIADCLLSILSQDVDANVRIVVGDDSSTDGTTEIVAAIAAQWPGRIEHSVHQERLGAIGNLRFVVGQAGGDFVAHLDGDDFWLPGKLREQLMLLENHPESPACFTNAFVFDDTRHPVGVFTNAKSGTYDLAALLLRGNFLNHSSLVYRVAHRATVLELPTPFIDYRIHLGLALLGPLVYTDKAFVGYRCGSTGSMLATANDAVRERYYEALLSAIPDVASGVRVAACADMMRRIIFRATRSRNPALVRAWWARLCAAAQVGSLTMLRKTILNVCGESYRQFVQIMSIRLLRASPRVLYFR
ncbi:glycosyltransferase [Luteibacter aegosomaticola]|uniref:glycosyltransferase family 2 protein n=1 Tax=Luteibacter aegosomaticola TaxID=2911538 RepID=UPI001FF8F7CC|nr:glycosyltransferase [Luteibacter aegosomaticola]UPG91436.1 glycosyltransferase [Luteibacter aegosomaticola]